MVRVKPDLLRALDTYIQSQLELGVILTRPEAMRRLAAEALDARAVQKPGPRSRAKPKPR